MSKSTDTDTAIPELHPGAQMQASVHYKMEEWVEVALGREVIMVSFKPGSSPTAAEVGVLEGAEQVTELQESLKEGLLEEMQVAISLLVCDDEGVVHELQLFSQGCEWLPLWLPRSWEDLQSLKDQTLLAMREAGLVE